MKSDTLIQMPQLRNLIRDRLKIERHQRPRLVIANHSDCTAGVDYENFLFHIGDKSNILWGILVKFFVIGWTVIGLTVIGELFCVLAARKFIT